MSDKMSKREYAAITLQVPDSGKDWLDKIIRQSLRDDLAGKAMQGLSTRIMDKYVDEDTGERISRLELAQEAYVLADAMLAAREGGE